MEHPFVRNYLRALHISVPTVQKLKSTITLQDFYHVSRLLHQFDEPRMNHPLLSPFHILQALFKSQPYSHNDPVIKSHLGPLCEVHLRKRFQLILNIMGLPTTSLSYFEGYSDGSSYKQCA